MVFGGLALLLVGALLVTVFTARWAVGHARGIWTGAATLWARLATRPSVQRLQDRFPFVWRLLRRLTATEYLILHLLLGLALAFAALGFIRIAEAVTGDALIVQVDMAVANALHEAATPAGIAFMSFYTFLGGGTALTVLALVVTVALVLRRQRVLAIGWFVTAAGGAALNGGLKALFERPRPSFAEPIHVTGGWSFPSGHSMGTFIIIGMLAYLIFIHVRSRGLRLLLVAVTMVWVTLMGFSRMYLGVHYLSDVVAGFAAGTVWLAGCISGVEVARRRWSGRPSPEQPVPEPRAVA